MNGRLASESASKPDCFNYFCFHATGPERGLRWLSINESRIFPICSQDPEVAPQSLTEVDKEHPQDAMVLAMSCLP